MRKNKSPNAGKRYLDEELDLIFTSGSPTFNNAIGVACKLGRSARAIMCIWEGARCRDSVGDICYWPNNPHVRRYRAAAKRAGWYSRK